VIVACLNFFEELPALKESVPTYYDSVDKIIAVDGAYKDWPSEKPYSCDGSLEYLKGLKKVELIETKRFWNNQCKKRSEYFKHGKKGDIFFIIDADEFVENPEEFRSFEGADVGQVKIKSPLYRKIYTEPRFFKWRKGLHYKGKHHWVYDNLGLVASHGEVASGIHPIETNVLIDHKRNFSKTQKQHSQKQTYKVSQRKEEKVTQSILVEPMNIAMFTSYDPAGVAFNLSEAINTTTPHTCKCFRKTNNYIDYPVQFETAGNQIKAREAIRGADIVHSHLHLAYADVFGINKNAKYAIHYHGTGFRNNPKDMDKVAKSRGVLQIVSNLELMQHADDLHFLENPVPFAKYSQMAKGRKRGKIFKIVHSPTSRKVKGTDILLKTIENLKSQKIPVELILIEKTSHKECLKRKVEADLAFDQLHYAMGVSALESACFGQPVIAGDEYVRKASIEKYGYCPYTFATEKTLEETIKKFILNEEFYEEEKKRMVEHVKKYHDYGSVARRYFDILDVKPKVVNHVLREGTDGIYVKIDVATIYAGVPLHRGAELEVPKDVAKRWISRDIATLIDKRFF